MSFLVSVVAAVWNRNPEESEAAVLHFCLSQLLCVRHWKRSPSFLIKDAEEYADLPVRHNEDQMNSELAKNVAIEVNPHSFDSSHTKAHLLMQAHFGRAVLPCPDYVTDTKTVLDQSIRICQVWSCCSESASLFSTDDYHNGLMRMPHLSSLWRAPSLIVRRGYENVSVILNYYSFI